MAGKSKPKVEWTKWLPPNEHAAAIRKLSTRAHTDDAHTAALSSFVKPRKTRVTFVHLQNVLVPSSDCNFWLGNTNFRISERLADKLVDVEGIERVHFLSRYRFRLLVAPLFSEEIVKREVAKVLITNV